MLNLPQQLFFNAGSPKAVVVAERGESSVGESRLVAVNQSPNTNSQPHHIWLNAPPDSSASSHHL
jgi:hypothetical protein